MAAGDGSPEPDDDEKLETQPSNATKPPAATRETDESDDHEDDDEEEEEEEEPRLKYATLTKNVNPIYRNGDATSTFLVAGDKMVSRAYESAYIG